MLTALSLIANIFIHELGMNSNLSTPSFSVSHITILFDCLSSCKAYLALVMTISLDEMHVWTYFDWRQLNYAVNTFSKVIIAIDPSISTSDSLLRIACLDDHLEWLIVRLRSMYMLSDSDESRWEAFTLLLSLWEATRSWTQSIRQQMASGYNVLQGEVAAQTLRIPEATVAQIENLPFRAVDLTDLWADDEFWVQMNILS